ncbi:MAG: hypothetical protein R3B09_12975 [Nannocystaceae bacterium]
MSRSPVWTALLLAALVGAGCRDAEPPAGDGSSTTSDDDDALDPWPGPISTVTSATQGSSGSDGSGGTTDTTTDDPGGPSTGEAIDAAPTILLTINDDAAPATISRAGTQTIAAEVTDDHGLALLEVFVGDDPAPFAALPLAGSTWERIEVPLPIYDDDQNGALEVHAVIHDDADQASASAAVHLDVKLPEGGSLVWESVSAGKFASKALSVAVDSIGDVIAVGSEDTTPDGHHSRMVIRKYHGESGALLWERTVPTQADVPAPPGNNLARGVTVDAYDNVYVVGEVRPDGLNRSLWLGKYTHDGLLAATYVSDAAMSRGNAVTVDGSGRVFVVGYRYDGQYDNVATIEAFDIGLKRLWDDLVLVEDYVDARFYGVAVDRTGKIVAVGSTRVDMTKTSQGLVALYSAEGAPQWARATTPFAPVPRERIFSVQVTDDNEYLCAGRLEAYDDPRRLWHVHIDESGLELDSHPDVLTRCGDPDFTNDTDVCGVGQSLHGGRLVWAGVAYSDVDDIQVMQTGKDGATHYWMSAINGYDAAIDRGLAVAVDADGFVSAAGYETKLGEPRWWVSRRNP